MNFLSEEKKAKLSEVLFYVALTIELGIMLLEKSVIHMYSYQSYVYRLTFLMTLIAVLLLKDLGKKRSAQICGIYDGRKGYRH